MAEETKSAIRPVDPVKSQGATPPPREQRSPLPSRDRKGPVAEPDRAHHYHRYRKALHLTCFLIFAALPFFNVMRFDIPRQRFYFAGQELWISEFNILFFSLMFLMFLIGAAALFYGRVYCGYICPQMIFSETSVVLEEKIKKLVTKKFIQWPAPRRALLSRLLFLAAVGAASVMLAFIFISYFVEPRDLLSRLFALDIKTAGGVAGATVTLITFLDFAFVRQRFCTTVCPYGYLQGMLGDKNTLLVVYRDFEQGKKECIECKKCVRVCHMGIDIRKSPFQIECVHCGECIDACVDVLGRLGKPGLIHYTWGEQGSAVTQKTDPWYKRLGFRDPKRVVILFVLAFYLTGLSVALSMRHPVLVQIAPERAKLYTVTADGLTSNQFRARMANRSSQAASVELSVEGVPGARLVMERNPVPLAEQQEVQMHFEIQAAAWPGARDVNPIVIVSKSQPGNTVERTSTTFLMPPGKP
ncbi:MAG: 4Fe-4S dicluster domain-containing protein [Bryobacteraceae bacterium]